MATLKARGGVIVLRASKTDETPNDELTTRRRTSVAIRYEANGTLRQMTKYDVWFRPDAYSHGKERPHSYGWKQAAKIKTGVSVETIRDTLVKLGYTIE